LTGAEAIVVISFGLEAFLSGLAMLAIFFEEVDMKSAIVVRWLVVGWGGIAALRSLVGLPFQTKDERS
jgi:hypothetical protein